MKIKDIIIMLVIALVIVGIALAAYIYVGKNSNTGLSMVEDQVRSNIGDNENADTDADDEYNEELEELNLTGDKHNTEEGTDREGNTVTATSEEGKPMIMLYWNAKEESSMEAVKILQSHYEKYKEKVDFMLIVAMDSEEDKESAESFLSENNIDMPVMYKTITEDAGTANEINNIPTLLVINKNGEKINTLIDHITSDAIEANLDIITENF